MLNQLWSHPSPDERRAAARTDPAAFRSIVRIDTAGGKTEILADVLEDWQKADFEALDSGWRTVAGQSIDSPQLRGYLERPRGHSKTADIATQATFALWSSPRPLKGIVGAGDKDQAGFIRDAIEKLANLNPWLQLKVDNWQVTNTETGSTLDILACDGATSFGETPDFIIADEVTHWTGERGKGFWTSLASSAAKRPNCMLVIIANAGHGKGRSWQWKLRETCRTLAAWHFSSCDGPKASWITKETLDEQRQIVVVPGEFNRVWLNQWQTGEGDALDPADLAACCTLRRPQEPNGRLEFVAGLDLGLKKDHAALVVLAVDGERQKLRLASCQSWKPEWDPATKTNQVDLKAVHAACQDAEAKYRLAALYYDPWQAAFMAQLLRDDSLNMVEQSFVGQNTNRFALALLEAVKGRILELWDTEKHLDPEGELLIKDLSRLKIVQKSYGFKLESSRDDDGHADRATALALMLPQATQFMLDLRQEIDEPGRIEV